jgi:hypothetical protein
MIKHGSAVPEGTLESLCNQNPALKRWAIVRGRDAKQTLRQPYELTAIPPLLAISLRPIPQGTVCAFALRLFEKAIKFAGGCMPIHLIIPRGLISSARLMHASYLIAPACARTLPAYRRGSPGDARQIPRLRSE